MNSIYFLLFAVICNSFLGSDAGGPIGFIPHKNKPTIPETIITYSEPLNEENVNLELPETVLVAKGSEQVDSEPMLAPVNSEELIVVVPESGKKTCAYACKEAGKTPWGLFNKDECWCTCPYYKCKFPKSPCCATNQCNAKCGVNGGFCDNEGNCQCYCRPCQVHTPKPCAG